MAVRHLNPPTQCDLCGTFLGNVFYDFRTKLGPWANGCPVCFKQHGGFLGNGRGQKFVKDINDEHFYKESG